MGSRKILGLMVLACAFGLSLAPTAAAIPNFAFYTHGGCPATEGNRIDPVNLMYFNWGTWDRATNQTDTHAADAYQPEWFSHGSAWPGWVGQAFKDNGTCYPADQGGTVIHMATDDWIYSRVHFREHPIPHDNSWGWTTIIDGHYEVVTTCSWWFRPSHAVPYGGFNYARDLVAGYFGPYYHPPNHGVAWGYYGNTDPRPQCTGDAPRSSGWVAAVVLHQINH
jgi:hypothetical protein